MPEPEVQEVERTTFVAYMGLLHLLTYIQKIKELVHRGSPREYKLLFPQVLAKVNASGHFLQSRGELEIRETKHVVERVPKGYQGFD